MVIITAQHIRRIKDALRLRDDTARDKDILERNLTKRQAAGETLVDAIVDIVERHMGASWWMQPELWADQGRDEVSRPCEVQALTNVYADARRSVTPGTVEPDEVPLLVRWIADQLYHERLHTAEHIAEIMSSDYPGRRFSPEDSAVSLELIHLRYGKLVEQYNEYLELEHEIRATARRLGKERRAGVRQLPLALVYA